MCSLCNVFEPLRSVIQSKHGSHVGEQSLGVKGQKKILFGAMKKLVFSIAACALFYGHGGFT